MYRALEAADVLFVQEVRSSNEFILKHFQHRLVFFARVARMERFLDSPVEWCGCGPIHARCCTVNNLHKSNTAFKSSKCSLQPMAALAAHLIYPRCVTNALSVAVIWVGFWVILLFPQKKRRVHT